MIVVKKKYSTEKYFSAKINLMDAWRFVSYIQSNDTNRKIGFIRKFRYTKILDIRNPEECFKNFNKNTRHEIRKAERLEICFQIEENFQSFIEYYNKFARSKGLNPLSANITKYEKFLTITKAVLGNETLCMHSYLIDKTTNKVRTFHSASLFRNKMDVKDRAIISCANRFLHYYDMLYFKKEGYIYFDLGGYAPNSKDSELENINKFKDNFGGNLIKEADFTSLPLFITNYFRNKFFLW